MYDALFFLVCISLSGVILLPALSSPFALQTSVETHREKIAEDVLHTYLVSRVNSFNYTFGGDLIDTVAHRLGINTSSEGLYQTIRDWILAHEQLHKTHAQLIAEDLSCQFQLPLTLCGSNRFNIFTADFDQQLKKNTQEFFLMYLGDKYEYNFTATWHPIKGIAFGGNLTIGHTPPTTNTHVASAYISIPYTPKITIGNTTILLTKHWVKTLLQTSFQWEDNRTGLSSIPALSNISKIVTNYSQHNITEETLRILLTENVSTLVNGFLVTGIRNETQTIVFPGVVNLTVTYGFEKIKQALTGYIEHAIHDFLGETFDSIDTIFYSLNNRSDNPLLQGIYDTLNESFHTILNISGGSLSEAFEVFETQIKETIALYLQDFLNPYIRILVERLVALLTVLLDLRYLIDQYIILFVDWIFDRVSLNTAEVSLTIWEMRG